MTDFKNTSTWEKKNASTILYRYEHEGKKSEGELEKRPSILHVKIDRLSVMDETTWTFAENKQPDSTTGFRSRDYIKVEGRLDRALVHVFAVQETRTATFDRIEISIYPVPIETLQASSKFERWSILGDKDRPEEGWLKDEHGRIDFNEANEYFDQASILARLFLDQATFDAVVQKIKNGGTIRKAHLGILADLFQFGYERAFARPMDIENYGILYEIEGRSMAARTNARLEELMLEWSPKLARPQLDVATLDDRKMVTADEDASERAVAALASDVKQIRARLDLLYQAAIALFVFVVVSSIIGAFS